MMLQNSVYTLEICVETPIALDGCRAFADRIELCSGLDVGGLTPSLGLMKQASAAGIETHVLIRPRAGDFAMTPADLDVAIADIETVRELGLSGIVIGAAQNGVLDDDAIRAMMVAAGDLSVTLHRVIDVLDDPIAAMETAIDLGMKRILTSGAAIAAPQGIAGLKHLSAASDGRIEIMAGAGITSATIGDIIAQTAIKSFHASCSVTAPLAGPYAELGFGKVTRSFDPSEAERMRACLSHAQTRVAP